LDSELPPSSVQRRQRRGGHQQEQEEEERRQQRQQRQGSEHQHQGRADDGDDDGDDDDGDDGDAEPLLVAPRELSDAIVGWFKSVSCGNEKLQVKKRFFANQNTVLPHDSASETDHPPHRLRLTVLL
jgi:hypothetical protein